MTARAWRLMSVPVAAALAMGAGGCGASEGDDKTVTVLAAASLTESFTTLARAYEKVHPGTHVEVSFAASSTIVTQLSHDAPADVVALADTEAPKKLPKDLAEGKAWTPFATNRLEIVTPRGNPAHVTGLADLAKVDTVLCAKEVPCGRAAHKALTKAKVAPHVVSYEKDVKATLAKVVAGDAEAALVYATDASSARSKVSGVEVPTASNVTTTLPITAWSDTADAKGFAQFVRSDEGRRVLQGNGFGLPG